MFLIFTQVGTVCDAGFSMSSATAICNEIGFYFAIGWSSNPKWSGQDSYSITMKDVICNGPSFANCSYSRSNWGCDHVSDISLNCSDCEYYLLKF